MSETTKKPGFFTKLVNVFTGKDETRDESNINTDEKTNRDSVGAPEISTDTIAYKQAWFDRPGLVLIARKLNSQEFSVAMGIQNYDAQQTKNITNALDSSENTHGPDMGKEVLGALNAIVSATANFEYKRGHLFAEMLNLSKVSNEAEQEFNKKLQKSKKSGLKAMAAIMSIANDPVMVTMGEGVGWKLMLRDRKMRETAFAHVKNYDLVAPFYFLLNSKNTHAPEGAAKVFSQWCKNKGVNLRQALIDYDLVDIGGPEPEIENKKQKHIENSVQKFKETRAWFERPELYDFQNSIPQIAHAMGISDDDFRKYKNQLDRQRAMASSIPETVLLDQFSHIDTLDADASAKKLFSFFMLLTLSKYEPQFHNGPTGIQRTTQQDHDASDQLWVNLLKNKKQREKFFEHVQKHDLLEPLFCLLSTEITIAPPGTVKLFDQWCQKQNINIASLVSSYDPSTFSRKDRSPLAEKKEPSGHEVAERSDETEDMSLASRFIRYGMSTGSKERNAELNALSVEELLEVPRRERDHAWLAHCIQKSPGYAADGPIIGAIVVFERETYSDKMTKERVYKTLSKRPELYTPFVPALWVEFEFHDSATSMGCLLERLPGNNPGLKGSGFLFSNTGEVALQKEPTTFNFIIKTSGGRLKTTLYRNGVRFKSQNKRELGFTKIAGHMMHLMLALNDPSQPLKLIQPESPADAGGKALGTMTLNGPSITLDIAKPPPGPEVTGELDRTEEESDDTPSEDDNESGEDNDNVNDDVIVEVSPEAPVLTGIVVQRIFREAGKTAHPNSSAEYKDDLDRMGWLSKQLQTLGSLENMNVNFEPHGQLADVLFSDDVMRALEFSHLLPNGKKNIPAVPPAIQDNLARRLKEIFSIAHDNTDTRPDDWERNERLKQRILEFPGLIIAGLGSVQLLRQSRDKYNIPLLSDIEPYAENNSTRRAALAFERSENARTLLMKATGAELPANELEAVLPAESSPVDEPQDTPEEQPSVDLPAEEIQEVDEPPVDQGVEAAQTEDGIQTPTVFPEIIAAPYAEIDAASSDPLSEDEKLDQLLKYDEAYAITEERLRADAQMYLMRALNRKCNQFECLIDLNKPGFAIHLRFFGEVDVEGEKRTRKEFHVLDKYDDAYREAGIPLTMENAVDLKIAVQSLILNTEGIVPAHHISATGSAAVAPDTQMPLPMLDYSVMQRTGGMCTLKYQAQDPYTRKLISASIPLGMAARYEDETAEQQELEERTEFVIDYLLKIGSHRTPEGFRVHIFKQDVMAKLKSWLEANDKEWETADGIDLLHFETSTLIHVFSQSSQKISLAPVKLFKDIGGENPSWHCDLTFYIGDKNKPPMGERVRTRSLYLRTRDQKLAKARALESLLGVEDKVKGLIPELREHMRKTGHEWRVKNGSKGDEVFIGDVKLQHFLNGMMRYERDIGVKLKKHEDNANGDVTITLQAFRCFLDDQGGTVKAVPEPVYEKSGDTRKPIAVTLSVPRNKADSIDAFVKKAHSHIMWYAEEAYSSVALGKDGQPDQHKKPLEYRTVQIRNALIRTVEAIYESHFGQRLPKNWQISEKQTAFSLAPAKNKPHTLEAGL